MPSYPSPQTIKKQLRRYCRHEKHLRPFIHFERRGGVLTSPQQLAPKVILLPLLPLLNVIIFTNLIRNSTTTRTNSSANQSTLTPTRQRSNHRTTRSRPADNLRSRMVTMIARRLLPNRTVMPLLRTLTPVLRKPRHRETQYRPNQKTSRNPIDLHKSILLPLQLRG